MGLRLPELKRLYLLAAGQEPAARRELQAKLRCPGVNCAQRFGKPAMHPQRSRLAWFVFDFCDRCACLVDKFDCRNRIHDRKQGQVFATYGAIRPECEIDCQTIIKYNIAL
jgi:hypothetical protein